MIAKFEAGQELKAHGINLRGKKVICRVRFIKYLDEPTTRVNFDGKKVTDDCIVISSGIRLVCASAELFL